jgi:hypothetical protein
VVAAVLPDRAYDRNAYETQVQVGNATIAVEVGRRVVVGVANISTSEIRAEMRSDEKISCDFPVAR